MTAPAPDREVVVRMEGSEMLLDALAAHGETLKLLADVIAERDGLRESVDKLRAKYEGKR